MHLVIKNLFQHDETKVLIAGVAKLILYCCYEVHFRANWLLKCDSPPQLVIGSIKTLPEQIMRLNNFCKTLKMPTKSILQIRTSYLQISVSSFEIGTFLSRSLKKSRFLKCKDLLYLSHDTLNYCVTRYHPAVIVLCFLAGKKLQESEAVHTLWGKYM